MCVVIDMSMVTAYCGRHEAQIDLKTREKWLILAAWNLGFVIFVVVGIDQNSSTFYAVQTASKKFLSASGQNEIQMLN